MEEIDSGFLPILKELLIVNPKNVDPSIYEKWFQKWLVTRQILKFV